MKRDLTGLTAERLDVVVIGGGIYGASIAREAARHGLRVGLIEQNDFGHATSANSQKIMHGGLRYLQHLDFGRMRQSVRARRHWLATAPHCVRPLRFVVPTSGKGLRSRAVMRAALAVNDLVSWDRNRGIDRARRIGRGGILSAAKCHEMIPGLDGRDVSGAAFWFDAFARDTERLCLSCVQGAAANDAAVANYVRADRLLTHNNTVYGVAATDTLTGRSLEIEARLVVAAVGPWSDQSLLQSQASSETVSWARAMNLVVAKRIFGDFAVGLPVGRYQDHDAFLDKGSRDIFFVPWGQRTIIGTFYDRHSGSCEQTSVTPSDIDGMIDATNASYPPASLTRKDISFVHIGLLPMRRGDATDPDIQLLKHATIRDCARDGGPGGLIVVMATKYTTAVETAKKTGNLLLRYLRREPHSPVSTVPRANRGPEFPEHAAYDEIDDAVLRSAIEHTVSEEMAMTLSDVVLRRLPLGSGGYPGRALLLRCAEILADINGWSADRTGREVENAERVYAPLFEAGCVARHPQTMQSDRESRR